MRRAVGDAVGLTIKAQLRQAARNLGYPADDWRVREAWYGRAGAWSAAALDDLRARHTAWRETGQGSRAALALRMAAIRASLSELGRQVDQLDAEVTRALSERQTSSG